MSAALARRDDGCASDLLMDRWLLGELPGSDEGRRFQEHLGRCSGCAARFQALRSLYGNRPMPKAEAPLPPLSAPAPVQPPEHAAVLQIIILRDGLLVGTEMFTAGRYTVGSAPTSGLRLEELATVHAAISLQGERVALEAAGGPVFVNGFRAVACELRPIDEVAIGPYVFRTRVIAERWQPPQLKVVKQDEDLPLPRRGEGRGEGRHALKLELYWGDTCVDLKVIHSPRDLRAFGIETVQPIDGGFSLDGLRITHGERGRFHVGQLVCIATAVPRAELVAKRRRQWPWAVTALAASLALCVIALGLYAASVQRPSFASHRFSRAQLVHLLGAPPRVTGPHIHAARRTPLALRNDDPAETRGPQRWRPPVGSDGPAVSSWPHRSTAGRQRQSEPRHGDRSLSGTTFGDMAGQPPTFDAGSLIDVIRSHRGDLERCGRHAAWGSRLTLEWIIQPSGSVSDVEVTWDDVDDATVTRCIAKAVERWQFPALTRPLLVTQPFVLDY